MIFFQFIDVDNPSLNESELSSWLSKVVVSEHSALGDMTIIFGSDEWLLDYNIKHLNHDYYTDIITFDYSTNNLVSGDLLISLDRVCDNAKILNVSRETEIHRVIVHGVLHLCGYSDAIVSEQKIMREKEDYYLSLL